ncbi:MAG: hypothetical protein FJ288_17480 [Planctomycetes bacterium]|nr:hypothetical protein [Planctomycetota bacterium]
MAPMAGPSSDNKLPPPRAPGDLRRLLAWLPHWTIAAALLVPVLIAEMGSLLVLVPWFQSQPAEGLAESALVIAALSLPGAIKRLRTWDAAVMIAVAAATFMATVLLLRVRIPALGAFPVRAGTVAAYAAMALGVGLAEMLLTGRRSWRAVGWVLTAAAAAACAATIVDHFSAWADVRINIPVAPKARGLLTAYHAAQMALAVLMWTAIPAALAAAEGGRTRRRLTAAALAASAALFAGLFGLAAYPLAERSLDGNGPFPKYRAALLLEWRRRPSDFERLAGDLEAADWTQGPSSDAPADWRSVYVGVLARHDAAAAAERMSRLLVSRPAPTLAWFTAGLLAQQKRYETAPVLMRYALRLADESRACTAAIEDMGVPEAAYVHLLVLAARRGPPTALEETEDFELDADDRQYLAAVLATDAGPNFQDWVKAYGGAVRDVPTPLPAEAAAEIARIIAAFDTYRRSAASIREARLTLARRMIVQDGLTNETAAFEQWCYEFGEDPDPPDPDDQIIEGYRIVREHMRRAAKMLAADGPDWCAPTTDAFLEEIDAHAARVEAAIAATTHEEPHKSP